MSDSTAIVALGLMGFMGFCMMLLLLGGGFLYISYTSSRGHQMIPSIRPMFGMIGGMIGFPCGNQMVSAQLDGVLNVLKNAWKNNRKFRVKELIQNFFKFLTQEEREELVATLSTQPSTPSPEEPNPQYSEEEAKKSISLVSKYKDWDEVRVKVGEIFKPTEEEKIQDLISFIKENCRSQNPGMDQLRGTVRELFSSNPVQVDDGGVDAGENETKEEPF